MTLRMIAGMLTPSKGTAFVDSIDVRKDKQTVKSKIGYMTNNTSLYDRLSVVETIKFFAELNQIPEDIYMPRAEKLFHQLDMTKYLSKRIADLSTGMKQKTSIARTIIHDPDVMIFDEPTSGLDVMASRAIVDLIKSCREEGKTVIFSTHRMGEVNQVCDDIAMIYKGKLCYNNTLDQFKSEMTQPTFEEEFIHRVGKM